MDKYSETVNILKSYYEFSDVHNEENKSVSFLYMGRKFLIFPNCETDTSYPTIYVEEDNDYTIPHIMPSNRDNGLRFVCIRQGPYINFLSSFEEKIHDACSRLITLMNLSKEERNKEFQNEFVFYWNLICESPERLDIFIGDKDNEFGVMNGYYKQFNGKIYKERLVKNGVKLNDLEKCSEEYIKWQHNPKVAAVYIPLITVDGLMPPTKDSIWTYRTIDRILIEQHEIYLSQETYHKLCHTEEKGNLLIVALGIPIRGVRECCTFTIQRCINTKEIIQDWIKPYSKIEPIRSARSDYYYLSKTIGNDVGLCNKNILVVGAGSLGSYICKELVKVGFKHLSVYDQDTLENANSFRWDSVLEDYSGSSFNRYKVDIIKKDLEWIHPEIIVDAFHENITEDKLGKISNCFDIVIFTVGNSDFQYLANRKLKKIGYQGWALYVWLEPGGNYSHILCINNTFIGCYQCLFTDNEGKLTSNKYNLERRKYDSELVMTNACGGTRAAYGNAVLLRTTAALIGQLQKILSGNQYENTLIDITPSQIYDHGDDFVNKQCKCCGNIENGSTEKIPTA